MRSSPENTPFICTNMYMESKYAISKRTIRNAYWHRQENNAPPYLKAVAYDQPPFPTRSCSNCVLAFASLQEEIDYETSYTIHFQD